jgi:hypothetical protein
MKFNFKKTAISALAGVGMLAAGTASAENMELKMATPWGGGVPFEDAKKIRGAGQNGDRRSRQHHGIPGWYVR